MRPRKNEETLVDVLDVLLMEGAVLRADVVVSVAGIPLIGIKLTAAIAGMETMNEYGLFETWDIERRQTSITRRQHKRERNRSPDELERLTVGTTPDGVRSRESDAERSRESDGEQSGEDDAERSRESETERTRENDSEPSGEPDAEPSREDDAE